MRWFFQLGRRTGGSRPDGGDHRRHHLSGFGPKIENGTIVLRDGKIEAVGAGVPVPDGARESRRPASGSRRGFIHGGSTLGLKLFDIGAQTGDPGGYRHRRREAGVQRRRRNRSGQHRRFRLPGWRE